MKTFQEVHSEYDEVISKIESLEVKERYEFLHLKAKIILVDGSELRISEVWIEEKLEKYSYYWLDGEDVIIGWDNAPHHEDIETFPFHKHENGEVKESEKVDSEKVLKKIKKRIFSE